MIASDKVTGHHATVHDLSKGVADFTGMKANNKKGGDKGTVHTETEIYGEAKQRQTHLENDYKTLNN